MSAKKVVFFIIIISSLFIINNLVRSIYTLSKKQQLVVDAREEVEREQEKNRTLKSKLNQTHKDQFIEEEARNKLFMSKPGDQVIVLSEKDMEATIAAKPKPKDTRPNWEKWWDLFF